MDLQTRKLHLISYLAELQDESFIERIEKLIQNKKSNDSKFETKRFTKNELINRAKKANKDYENGKILSQEKLEETSSNW